MKKILIILLIIIVGPLSLSAQGKTEPEYILHEWGTFTSLYGSSGGMLSGLQREEEQLPYFVYSHAGFEPRVSAEKGLPQACSEVTVKMETPVLYFYAKQEMQVALEVKFPRGAISQWYPGRTAGERSPRATDSINFAGNYNGWIKWDTKILAPNATDELTQAESTVNHTWQAPRATDANKVMVNDEVEKYLFYRGVGNFLMPVSLKFNNTGGLAIENVGRLDIAYVFVYEKKQDNTTRIWWDGPLPAYGQVTATKNNVTTDAEAKIKELEKALVAAGLYEKEAAAMINTWRASYFDKPGIKVFWVVPTEVTEEILPLTATPAPASVSRVLIGRNEILSPEFEQQLASDFKTGKAYLYENDRYFLAYKQRVAEMEKEQQGSGMAETGYSSPVISLTAFPNPAGDYLNILIKDIPTGLNKAELKVTDITGKVVLQKSLKNISEGKTEAIDIKGLAPGAYHIQLTGRFFTAHTAFQKQ